MSESAWLEVSLVVDGELAESVAEVFFRFAPNGVAIESALPVGEEQILKVQHSALLRVSAYLPVDRELDAKKVRLEESLWYLGRIQPVPQVNYRIVQQADWAEAWKKHYHPISLGRRLIIVPAWLQPTDAERVPIYMDPGMAFGTGTHPSTQLCLEIIENILEERNAARRRKDLSVGKKFSVIDLGCGSGILSVAALKLGASHALGVDTDPIAVKAARENASLNGVADRMAIGFGSLEEIKAGLFSFSSADLVLANILAPVLVCMLDAGLGTLLLAGGKLVLSGVVKEQLAAVHQALDRNGLQVGREYHMGDWVALLAFPKS